MNERIKQFALQAGGEFYEGFAGSPNAVRFMETDLEKFAKAIVQECVHVAVYKDDGMVSTADVAGYMAAGRAGAAKIIKQHFGGE
jgi:hypothetical protein